MATIQELEAARDDARGLVEVIEDESYAGRDFYKWEAVLELNRAEPALLTARLAAMSFPELLSAVAVALRGDWGEIESEDLDGGDLASFAAAELQGRLDRMTTHDRMRIASTQ